MDPGHHFKLPARPLSNFNRLKQMAWLLPPALRLWRCSTGADANFAEVMLLLPLLHFTFSSFRSMYRHTSSIFFGW